MKHCDSAINQANKTTENHSMEKKLDFSLSTPRGSTIADTHGIEGSHLSHSLTKSSATKYIKYITYTFLVPKKLFLCTQKNPSTITKIPTTLNPLGSESGPSANTINQSEFSQFLSKQCCNLVRVFNHHICLRITTPMK